jgi:hypothetical protein
VAITENLKVEESWVREGTCISSNVGDHFWYRDGHWEQLQTDGSYQDCDEPSPKDTYVISLDNGEQYRWYPEEEKWDVHDTTTPWDLTAMGILQ